MMRKTIKYLLLALVVSTVAVEAPDGTVTYSQLPQHLFTRETPLKPIRA